jgi:hypothetical protein
LNITSKIFIKIKLNTCEFAFSRNRRKSPISDRFTFTTFSEVIVWLAGGNDGRIFGAVFGPGDAVRDELVGVDVDDDEEEEEDLLESLKLKTDHSLFNFRKFLLKLIIKN